VPIIEEFDSARSFIQTSDNVYILCKGINCDFQPIAQHGFLHGYTDILSVYPCFYPCRAFFFFTNCDLNKYIEGGQVNWHIQRNGGVQYVYRSIPPFSGNVRLTARGQVDSWTNGVQIDAVGVTLEAV
jgi:hypothetical protein